MSTQKQKKTNAYSKKFLHLYYKTLITVSKVLFCHSKVVHFKKSFLIYSHFCTLIIKRLLLMMSLVEGWCVMS